MNQTASDLPQNHQPSERYDLVIDGQARATSEYQVVRNPFDLTAVGEVAVASVADVELAVTAADAAFRSWSSLADSHRSDCCRKIANTLEEHAEELAMLVTLEQGKPLDGAGLGSRFELGGCAAWAMATADLHLSPKVLIENDELLVRQMNVPLGVVAAITPWNWPLLIAIWHILPAIRAGNTVVIKPSPYTPLATARAVLFMQEVLPPGVVNLVSGDGNVGSALSSHPKVKKISFTGSTPTGQKVMSAASSTLKRLTLELGGNDAAIVLPETDLSAFLEPIFNGAFINSGQTCGAIKRLYVPRELFHSACVELAEFASKQLVGDGRKAETRLGPVQNEPQFNKVRALLKNAIDEGATIFSGGKRVGDGYGFEPTIVGVPANSIALVQKEQFGPLLPVIPYDSVEQAIGFANDSEYGLCASVWGDNPEQLDQVANCLEAGTVYYNTHAELHPMVPFSGHKSSGLGVQFGEEGLAEFTDTRVQYQRLASPAGH
ncbi:MAG: aldehyde dehydrogenase family protein [Pseudomonadota bacterium]